MSKIRAFLRTPLATVLLFVLAVGLLLTGTIGGVRAAPLIESRSIASNMGTQKIGVTLIENGTAVGWRDYADGANGRWNEKHGGILSGLIPEGEDLQFGRAYPEALAVKNSGSIDIYVRVSLYRYWRGADGKRLDLAPEYVVLGLRTGNDWVVDEAASTRERTVLYYTKPLAPGETTPDLTESLLIDAAVRTAAHLTGGAETAVAYDYDNVEFRLETEVDAVQTHNAADAIRSAWGREVTVSDGVLTLR